MPAVPPPPDPGLTPLQEAQIAKSAEVYAHTADLEATYEFPFDGNSYHLNAGNTGVMVVAFNGLSDPSTSGSVPPVALTRVDGVTLDSWSDQDNLRRLCLAWYAVHGRFKLSEFSLLDAIAAAPDVPAVEAITDSRAVGDVFPDPDRFLVGARGPTKGVRFQLRLDCEHLGNRLPSTGCQPAVYLCKLFKDRTVRIGACDKVERTCQTCVHYVGKVPGKTPTALPPSAARTGRFGPRSGRVVVTCGVGDLGREWLSVTGPVMERYAARVGADFDAITGGGNGYPLWDKFKAADYLDRYDRVLFLDADVVLAPDTPDVFDIVPEGRLGLRDDWPYLVAADAEGARTWMYRETEVIRRASGRPGTQPNTCYNTGVLVFDRVHRHLFTPPVVPLPAYHCTEQHWFNLNVLDAGIKVFELPWELHWHPFADPKRVRTDGVKVWHFAGEPDRAAKLRGKVRELYRT